MSVFVEENRCGTSFPTGSSSTLPSITSIGARHEHIRAAESPLTRRQLRELRNTGATPVVPGLVTPPAEPAAPEPSGKAAKPGKGDKADKDKADKPEKGDKAEKAAPVSTVVADPAPVAPVTESVDLGVAPLTRRSARQQERIRTASIPVVSPDIAPAAEATVPVPPADAPVLPKADAAPSTPDPAESLFRTPVSRDVAGARPLQVAAADLAVDTEEAAAPTVTVNPAFGAGLLAADAGRVDAATSFDQLVARSGSVGGSMTTPNALILSQSPAAAPLVGPITATGEVLVTGTFALPEGLGSTGHAPGTADGAEADVVLLDGELPASSSPTPIAASAAISTVKDSDEIIRPPAPERGSRLMLVLAITAGALALALVGVLIVAVVTGVFS